MTSRAGLLAFFFAAACGGGGVVADAGVADLAVTATTSDAATSDVDAATCPDTASNAKPGAASYQATIGGQTLWVHDDGLSAGYFHTYDALTVGASGESPHKVHVFLPWSYQSSCAHYPVVYMNDGNTTFWPGGLANKTWDLGAALASLYQTAAIPEVIVVAIEPLDRNREYTNVEWQTGTACCGLPGYVSFLADALKPFIDANYRTTTDAAHTLVVGSSHGGLASFFTAATRPEVFGNAISMSSSFWVGLDDTSEDTPVIGGPLDGSALTVAVGPTLATGHPRLYMDWGLVRTGGAYNSSIELCATNRSKELAGILEAKDGYTLGTDLFTVEDPLGEHDETSWGRRIGPALQTIWGGL